MAIGTSLFAPQVNQSSIADLPPADDFSSSVAKGYQMGQLLSGAVEQERQLKIAQLQQEIAAYPLKQKIAEQQLLNASYQPSKLVEEMVGDTGVVTNADTGPRIPTGTTYMDETLRFAAPTGGGQVPADTVSLGVPGYPGLGRSPSLRVQEDIDKEARTTERLKMLLGQKIEGQKEVAQIKAKGGMLTPNRQSAVLSTLGKGGVDPKQFLMEDGTYDWNAASTMAGKIERENTVADMQAKLNAVPAEARTAASRVISVIESTDRLADEINSMSAEGKAPSWWDNAVATATREPASTFLGALATQVMKETQGKDSKELESLKAIMSAALLRANAGLAQTNPEMASSSAYRPLATDSLYDTIMKLQNIRPQLIIEANNLLTPANTMRERLEEFEENPPKLPTGKDVTDQWEIVP